MSRHAFEHCDCMQNDLGESGVSLVQVFCKFLNSFACQRLSTVAWAQPRLLTRLCAWVASMSHGYLYGGVKETDFVRWVRGTSIGRHARHRIGEESPRPDADGVHLMRGCKGWYRFEGHMIPCQSSASNHPRGTLSFPSPTCQVASTAHGPCDEAGGLEYRCR